MLPTQKAKVGRVQSNKRKQQPLRRGDGDPSQSGVDATAGAGLANCPRTPHPFGKALRWVEHFLAVVGLCFIVYTLCFQMIVMTSDSMKPTLQGTSYENGDRVLVEKVTKHWRSPRR